jgi:hypothetical protein
MSTFLTDKRPLRVAIGEIGITAASPLEARRLADALPAALNRAFARLPTGAPPIVQPRQRRVDRVAAQIARAVAERLEAHS